MYSVSYVNGKKTKQGELENGAVSTDMMRRDYQSLAKKSLHGKEFMKKYDIGDGSSILQQTNAW